MRPLIKGLTLKDLQEFSDLNTVQLKCLYFQLCDFVGLGNTTEPRLCFMYLCICQGDQTWGLPWEKCSINFSWPGEMGRGSVCKVMVSGEIWWGVFDHHSWMPLDTFIALPLEKNTLLTLVLFPEYNCQQRYFHDCCLGYNKLCFTRNVRIFIHNKTEKQLPKQIELPMFFSFGNYLKTNRCWIHGPAILGPHLSLSDYLPNPPS